MTVVGGYTLYYFDERTGEHVSVPLTDVTMPRLMDRSGGVVVYDEMGDISEEALKSAAAYAETHELRRLVLIDAGSLARAEDWRQDLDPSRVLDLPTELHCEMELKHLDMDVVRGMQSAFYDMTRPHVEPRLPRQDWHDRNKQHRNRKRRAWR